MDQICPRCGCRSFHYNRSRMRVECDACGHALTDPQELQLQRQDDRNFQQACEHLRAGNWQQAAGLLLPLMERRPVDRRLYLAAFRAATKDYQDLEAPAPLRMMSADTTRNGKSDPSSDPPQSARPCRKASAQVCGAANTSAAVAAPSKKSPGYSRLQLLLISTPSPSIYMEAWAVQCTKRGTGGTKMARAHHDRRTPGDWLRGLFRQPPPGFYSRPAVYLSGDRMEIEHFCTVLFFDENKLCLRLAKGRFTVYGSGLRICTLTAARLTVQGQFLRTDFSDE